MKKRYIAFDIGDRRIGIAVTDPFGNMVLPVETYNRRNLTEDIQYLVCAAEGRSADGIVCGLPVNIDGTDSVQTEKTRRFIAALEKETHIPVEIEDESYSTMQAHEVLLDEDMPRGKRKKHVDALAAVFILQNFLDRKKWEEKRTKNKD